MAAAHIGIVAVSAEGAALCYRTICVEGGQRLGAEHHPEVTMHTNDLGDYIERCEAGDWEAVGRLLLDSAQKLANVGADFLICPDNTVHQGLDLVLESSPLPWLHIADVVAAEAAERGYRKVGVTGTRMLMEGPVYPARLAAHGIESLIPSLEQRAKVDHIIFTELLHGVVLADSLQYFQGVIRDLGSLGCDAVALSCTELPLLISSTNSPLPVLDSTRLLARAALRKALSTETGTYRKHDAVSTATEASPS